MWDRGHGIYSFSRLTEFLDDAIFSHNIELVQSGKITYFNIPCSFDIETSSWTDERGNHYACMYIWQFGLNGSVIYGRTWDEFGMLLAYLDEKLELSESRHLVIYVHNLGYEFQFIRKYFNWSKVFAIKRRRPVYAISGGFEFRCSLFLSNYALAYIGDNLLFKYPVRKLVGNLDYSKVRHSLTHLTAPELHYCINDVQVVMSYIQEKIEHDGDISEIPLTNTGYVRNYCRSECFYEGAESLEEREKIRKSYHSIMKALVVTSSDEYNQLKRAFMGGFTHASALYSGKIMNDVGSADLTSSYPFCIVCQYFPMSRFQLVGEVSDEILLKKYLQKYCCLFDIEFTNLQPRVEFENIISESRCWDLKGYHVNNGRIISADSLRTTLTELDFESVAKFYSWDSCRITNFRIAHRGYLPKALILAVLKLYQDKTELKGIAGKEIEYLVSKNMINAAFGMMVTAIIRGEYVYDDTAMGWTQFEADVEEQLSSYNKNFNRFLYYGWGVYVTAHARHNLFSAIWEFGADYIYADTDSVKGINFSEHLDYFKSYNDRVFDGLLRMCVHYNIPFEKVRPKNRKGESKLIGAWEIEEGYKIFKTCGAKRYIYVTSSGILNITVSGVNKKFAVPYLLYKYGGGSNYDSESLEFLKSNNRRIDPSIPPFIQLSRLIYQNLDNKEEQEAKQLFSTFTFDFIPIFFYFGDGLFIPPEHTGKNTIEYIDDEFSAVCTDYLGVPLLVNEGSAVYMEPQHYLMSQTSDYLRFLSGIQEVYY